MTYIHGASLRTIKMKSRSSFGMINRNVDELSYVQVNIYGTKLNDLRRKGVDVIKLLKGVGVAECLMWEVPLPPKCGTRTTKLVGGSGMPGSTRKSLRRVRSSVSGGSTGSSSGRSGVSIKEEEGQEMENQREVRRPSHDLAGEGGENFLQESELLMNCSISTIHSSSSRTEAPREGLKGSVSLARHTTIDSDFVEEAYPPLVAIPPNTNDVIQEDSNGVTGGKVLDDVEIMTAVTLDDHTHLFDPNIDYMAPSLSPPFVDDVIQGGGADDDVIRVGGAGYDVVRTESDIVMTGVIDEVVKKSESNNVVEDADMAIPTAHLPLKPYRLVVEEIPCDDVTSQSNERTGKESNAAQQPVAPLGDQISSKECSAAPALSENTVEGIQGANQPVGDNQPIEPANEAVGSNSNCYDDLNMDDDDGEFFDCSLGSFSDDADASMVESTSAARIPPTPVSPRQTCSLSAIKCGTRGIMKEMERKRSNSLQETPSCQDVIGGSSLSEAVSKWTFVPSEPPQSMAESRLESVVSPPNQPSQGSSSNNDLNARDTVGLDQTPSIEAASSTLNHSNLQNVLQSEENGAGFFYGGLYFDASFRSVVSHPSLIMEVDSSPNQEVDGSQGSAEAAAVEEEDHSVDQLVDQPMESVTGPSTIAPLGDMSQPPVSQGPPTTTSHDISIDHPGISTISPNVSIDGRRLSTPPPNVSIDPNELSTDRPGLSTNDRNLSIDPKESSTDRPQLSTPPPNISIDEKDVSIDRRHQLVAYPSDVSEKLENEDSEMRDDQATGSTCSVKMEEQGSVTRSGVRLRTLRKRKNSQVSCDSSSTKNCTPHGTLVSDGEQFQCMYPGCFSKFKWRSRYGKDRLLNHVRLHWAKHAKKCPSCDFTAAVSRTVRRHFEQEHVNERWEGHVNLETREDVSELAKLWRTCFPSALGENNSTLMDDELFPPGKGEMKRIVELHQTYEFQEPHSKLQ